MATETAWLIEFKQSVSGRPAWYGDDGDEGLGMVLDANQAIRFARKQDAETIITDIGWTEAFASEHVWCDGKPKVKRLRTRNPMPSGVSRPDGSRPKP